MSQPKIKRRVGKYEVGRTIGEGTFAKVKFARNSETGDVVALKILDKEKVLKHKMAEQIKREVATMKLIKHPNVVRLYEVLGYKAVKSSAHTTTPRPLLCNDSESPSDGCWNC